MSQLSTSGFDKSVETGIVNGRYGEIHYLIKDDPIGRSLYEYGEWGQLELEKILSLIQPGDHVLDIGANIGSYTLGFSRKLCSGGRVLAIEAQPFLCGLLKKTVEQNNLANVEVIQKAVSQVSGELFFDRVDYSEHINVGAIKLSSTARGNGQRVEAVTIDQLKLERCDLIKCDVEGMSCEVMLGARDTIATFKPIIVSEVNDVKEGVELFTTLRSFGYDVWLIQSPAYNPHNFKRNPQNTFGHAAELAIVGVHMSRQSDCNPDQIGVKVSNLDDLATLILQCPQYGDSTSYDRNWSVLLNKLTEANHHVDSMGEAHKRLSYRLALLEKRSAEFEKLSELQAHNQELTRQLHDTNTQLIQVYQSRSWRLMEPLRFVSRIIRRILKGS